MTHPLYVYRHHHRHHHQKVCQKSHWGPVQIYSQNHLVWFGQATGHMLIISQMSNPTILCKKSPCKDCIQNWLHCNCLVIDKQVTTPHRYAFASTSYAPHSHQEQTLLCFGNNVYDDNKSYVSKHKQSCKLNTIMSIVHSPLKTWETIRLYRLAISSNKQAATIPLYVTDNLLYPYETA